MMQTNLSAVEQRHGRSLATVIQKAIATPRTERFQSIEAFKQAITRITDEQHRETSHQRIAYWLLGMLACSALSVLTGYLLSSEVMLEVGILLLYFSALLGGIWCLIKLSYRFFEALRPLWNKTYFTSFVLSLAGVLMGSVIYALGYKVVDELPADFEPIWYVRLLRYLTTGIILSFIFSFAFALSAARRQQPNFAMAGWRAISWLCMASGLLIMLYSTTHIIEHSTLAWVMGSQLQGDVRLEIYILQVAVSILLMIVYTNWKQLDHASNQQQFAISGTAFVSRMLAATSFIGLSGIFLASSFWGQGLMANRPDAAFAVFAVAMLTIWGVICFCSFTGQHLLVRWHDKNCLAKWANHWQWPKKLQHTREKYQHAFFSQD